MKPCAFTGQTLLDHSLGSLKATRKVMGDSYIETAIRRFRKLGLELKREYFELAVMLHDIGKAGEYYQAQFDDGCKPVKREPTFLYHEIGSALFFFKNFEYPIRKLLAITALNHLNAIRGLSDLDSKRFPRGFDLGMIRLKKYGKVILEQLGLESYSVEDYTFDDYNEMLTELARSNEPFLKLYSLFLAPVIIGDNLDSAMARSQGTKRRFIQILEKEVSSLDSPSI